MAISDLQQYPEHSALSDHSNFKFLKTVYFLLRFLCERKLSIYCLQEATGKLSELSTFGVKKRRYLHHFITD